MYSKQYQPYPSVAQIIVTNTIKHSQKLLKIKRDSTKGECIPCNTPCWKVGNSSSHDIEQSQKLYKKTLALSKHADILTTGTMPSIKRGSKTMTERQIYLLDKKTICHPFTTCSFFLHVDQIYDFNATYICNYLVVFG